MIFVKDIWFVILNDIVEIKDWQSIVLTCRFFYRLKDHPVRKDYDEIIRYTQKTPIWSFKTLTDNHLFENNYNGIAYQILRNRLYSASEITITYYIHLAIVKGSKRTNDQLKNFIIHEMKSKCSKKLKWEYYQCKAAITSAINKHDIEWLKIIGGVLGIHHISSEILSHALMFGNEEIVNLFTDYPIFNWRSAACACNYFNKMDLCNKYKHIYGKPSKPMLFHGQYTIDRSILDPGNEYFVMLIDKLDYPARIQYLTIHPGFESPYFKYLIENEKIDLFLLIIKTLRQDNPLCSVSYHARQYGKSVTLFKYLVEKNFKFKSYHIQEMVLDSKLEILEYLSKASQVFHPKRLLEFAIRNGQWKVIEFCIKNGYTNFWKAFRFVAQVEKDQYGFKKFGTRNYLKMLQRKYRNCL